MCKMVAGFHHQTEGCSARLIMYRRCAPLSREAEMIFRLKQKKIEQKYVKAYFNLIRNDKLSFRARGLHVWMQSMPDNWQFYLSEIKNHCTEGRQAVATALKELIDAGYLVRSRLTDPVSGKWLGYDYTVYPINAKDYVEFVQGQRLLDFKK